MKPRPQDLTPDQLSYYAAVTADVGVRKSISRIYIPKQTGKACAVAAHQVLRVTCCDGPQVADFNAFAQNDPSEYFWSGRTRTLPPACRRPALEHRAKDAPDVHFHR